MIGEKFGRLTVVERAEACKDGRTRWKCICSCKNKTEIIALEYNLKRHNTNSCGCYQRERASEAHKTHGKRKSRLYKTWADIKQRCYNQNEKCFNNYGGRGITIAPRWKDDFKAFYDDVSKLPHFNEKGYSLDRIDNNGNYEINNVRWATKKEQNNNKRNNHLIEYKGEKHTIAEWAAIKGLKRSTLERRINELGWNVETALNKPSRLVNNQFTNKKEI